MILRHAANGKECHQACESRDTSYHDAWASQHPCWSSISILFISPRNGSTYGQHETWNVQFPFFSRCKLSSWCLEFFLKIKTSISFEHNTFSPNAWKMKLSFQVHVHFYESNCFLVQLLYNNSRSPYQVLAIIFLFVYEFAIISCTLVKWNYDHIRSNIILMHSYHNVGLVSNCVDTSPTCYWILIGNWTKSKSKIITWWILL